MTSRNLTNPALQSITAASITYGNIREEKAFNVYLSDDRTPVQQLIDQILIDVAVHSGLLGENL